MANRAVERLNSATASGQTLDPALSMQQAELPQTVHVTTPNPARCAATPQVSKHASDDSCWIVVDGEVRIWGVAKVVAC